MTLRSSAGPQYNPGGYGGKWLGSSLQNPERPGQLDKEIFLKVEETRPGVGRRRLRGKAVRRTIPF